MMRYLFYPVFGAAVLGGYAWTALEGVDVTSVDTTRSAIPTTLAPVGAGPETYATAPIVWRTGFHGPGAYTPTYYGGGGTSGGGSSYGGGGGGGFWGGFGGGK